MEREHRLLGAHDAVALLVLARRRRRWARPRRPAPAARWARTPTGSSTRGTRARRRPTRTGRPAPRSSSAIRRSRPYIATTTSKVRPSKRCAQRRRRRTGRGARARPRPASRTARGSAVQDRHPVAALDQTRGPSGCRSAPSHRSRARCLPSPDRDIDRVASANVAAYVLNLVCPDRPGIVATVAKAVFDLGGNITENHQFSDEGARCSACAPGFETDLLDVGRDRAARQRARRGDRRRCDHGARRGTRRWVLVLVSRLRALLDRSAAALARRRAGRRHPRRRVEPP